MATFVTNGNAFPGTSININDNITNLAIGDKLLLDAGIINTIILGNWNRLVAGASTVIGLGTKMNATFANSVSVTDGNLWSYSAAKQICCDNDLKYAFKDLIIKGGSDKNSLDRQRSESQQSALFFYTIIITFTLTIGVSLLNIQIPAFTVNGSNGNNDITTDPSTGEIIDVGGAELNTTSAFIYSTIFELLMLILLFFEQWYTVKKFANNISRFDAVSNLFLDNNNLMGIVFSENKDNNNQQSQAYAKLHMYGKSNIVLTSVFGSNLYSALHVNDDSIKITANIPTGINHTNSANIVLGNIQNMNNRLDCVLIENTNHDDKGSAIYMDKIETIIYRNHGEYINLTFRDEAKAQQQHSLNYNTFTYDNPELHPSDIRPMPDNYNSDDDEDEDERSRLLSSRQGYTTSELAALDQSGLMQQPAVQCPEASLTISHNNVLLATAQAEIRIDNDDIIIRSNRKNIAAFMKNGIGIGSLEYTKHGTYLGECSFAKNNTSAKLIQEVTILNSTISKIEQLIARNKESINQHLDDCRGTSKYNPIHNI